jgi:hypothetical protein
MEVGPLSRGVMLPHGATPISLITRELSLPPSSFIRSSIGVPCSSLSLEGELRTYHVPLVCLDGLGPYLFAGDGVVSDEGNWIPSYLITYLLVQAYQHLWLVDLDDVYQ